VAQHWLVQPPFQLLLLAQFVGTAMLLVLLNVLVL